jgi:tRNA/tmRNA/rRNA uracil-C5-methylase (TrmA/RlmC/RlmD family)
MKISLASLTWLSAIISTANNTNLVTAYSTSSSSSSLAVSPQTTALRNSTPLNCPHFKECPGCITPTAYTDIPIINSAKLFFSSSSIQQKTIQPREDFYQTVLPSDIQGWRTQAKLAVQPASKWGAGCVFGLYERKSHALVQIPDCIVHHPKINQAIHILKQATKKVNTPAWNEDKGTNGLRYVQLSIERMTGRVSLTLVWNASNLKQCQPHLSRLMKECKRMDREMKDENNEGGPGLFHSIFCHTNDGLGNAIFARGEKNWHPMDGPEFTREVMPGTNVEDREGLLHFTPMVFRQGNLDGFDEIAMHVAKSVGGGKKVCELYAGVGLLGLTALTHWQKEGEPLGWVRCSDENPHNPRCFKRTLNSM